MGKFSRVFGGNIRRVIMYFLGIGLGGWFSVQRQSPCSGILTFLLYWLLPCLHAACQMVCVGLVGLPLWEDYLDGAPQWVVTIASDPEHPIYASAADLACLVWFLMFLMHLGAVFVPKMHYMMNPFQYQASVLQLMDVHPLISELPQRLFLTDGGHVENFGLFPLLHQRCQEIVMVDAESSSECKSLRYALDLGRKVLGISFYCNELDLEQAISCFERNTKECLNFGVCYLDGTRGSIFYLKLKQYYPKFPAKRYGCCCCSCNDSHCDFLSPHPHHSTLNQCYYKSTWKFYYKLGLMLAQEGFKQKDRDNLVEAFICSYWST